MSPDGKEPPPLPPAATRQSAVRYPMRPQRAAPLALPVRPPVAPLDLNELAALGSLPLRARCLADAVGAGRHRSRRKGASVEFADYRDYQPGDDLRRVDWRLYGRTDRVQIRNAHEDTPLRVVLVLDVSASMSYAGRPGGLTKLDLARAVLGAIALLVQTQRDACGLAIVANDLLHYLPPTGSPARLRNLWALLERPALATPTSLAAALERVAEVVPSSCLFVLASDFYESPAALESAIGRLHFDRHDVLGLQIADQAEADFPFADAVEFQDAETGLVLALDAAAAAQSYRAAFDAHQQAVAEAFRGRGFDHLVLRSDRSPLAALSAYLSRRAGKG